MASIVEATAHGAFFALLPTHADPAFAAVAATFAQLPFPVRLKLGILGVAEGDIDARFAVDAGVMATFLCRSLPPEMASTYAPLIRAALAQRGGECLDVTAQLERITELTKLHGWRGVG